MPGTGDRHIRRDLEGNVLVPLQGSWDSIPRVGVRSPGHYTAQPRGAPEAKGRGVRVLKSPPTRGLLKWPLLNPCGQVRSWKGREEAKVMGSIPLVITLRPSSLTFQPKFPRHPLCTASPAPHPPKAVVAGPCSSTRHPQASAAPWGTCAPEPLLQPRPCPCRALKEFFLCRNEEGWSTSRHVGTDS